MLHPIRILKNVFLFLVPLTVLFFAGCRSDSAASSEEETAYMADYESPDSKWGFIDTTGSLVIPAKFDDVGPFSEGLSAVNVDGKWGFINKIGELVIPAVYKSAWAFHEGFARVLPFDAPDHYITPDGEILSGETWAAADDFSNGRARVLVGNVFGYIDKSGNLIIQPIYSRGWNFNDGVCIVEYQDKQGVISLNGESVLNPEFDQIKRPVDEQVFLCKKGISSYVFDLSGNEISKRNSSKIIDATESFYSMREGNLMYLIDTKDSTLRTSSFTNIIYLGENLWAGKRNSGYQLLGDKGIPLSQNSYTQINRFSDGFAAYSKGDYWGYMDTTGRELTGEIFGLAWDYREGFARAAFKEGIAFINTKQELAFYPPRGTLDMRDFSEGLASVQIQ